MAARKKPTGWVQDIAPPRSLFLRRKVARSEAMPDLTYAVGPGRTHIKEAER